MKKLLLALFFIPFIVSSQTLNGYNIEDLPAKYIEIVGTAKLLKPLQVTVTINYGQAAKVSDWRKLQVLGEDGKRYPFNGMMGAVNFFNEKGYSLFDAYPISVGNSSVYHYIMVKD